ncbi:MAG: O-antigen ligase family protein [Candidatus Halalkalibacterium sp. M3_1C_030]
MQRPLFWLYAFFLAFLVSVIFYDFRSLVDFGFYRRDGNFIISYAPILVLPLFNLRIKLENYLRYFYRFALGLYSIIFAYYLVSLNISADLNALVFGGLFYAQNAVGGFLSILGALGFAYFYNRKTKKEFFYFFLILAMLFMTYSRGSILGLILGIAAWYLAVNKHFKTLVVLISIPVLLTVATLMIGYPSYQSKISTGNLVEEKVGEDIGTKNANVILRILYTFPRAYYSFTHSPIVGTGVGSFDDRPYNFEPIVPYVAYNAQPNKAHTDSHAHHSYLHILAEQGVFGLGLFITFWVSLFLYLMNLKYKPLVKDFLLIAFFTITFASFTEHRITTPSMMLPFTIVLGLHFANRETFRKVLIVQK